MATGVSGRRAGGDWLSCGRECGSEAAAEVASPVEPRLPHRGSESGVSCSWLRITVERGVSGSSSSSGPRSVPVTA